MPSATPPATGDPSDVVVPPPMTGIDREADVFVAPTWTDRTDLHPER